MAHYTGVNTSRSRGNIRGEESGMALATSPRLPVTRLEGTSQTQSSSSIVALHKYISSLITMLGFCLQLKFANASPFVTDYDTILITLFIIDLYAYFGSLAVMMMIVQATPSDTELGEFLNKISFLFGILALILELLILVPPLGWVPLFFWSIYFVSIAIKSYRLLKTQCDRAIAAFLLGFGKLKEKLIMMNGRFMECNAIATLVQAFERLKELAIMMNGHLMESRAVTGLGGAYEKLKELFRSPRRLTEHEPRDRITEVPV